MKKINKTAKILMTILAFVTGLTGKSHCQGQTTSQHRFAVIGDYGMDNDAELKVANLVKGWTPDFIITVGDDNYADQNGKPIDQNVGRYFADYICPYVGNYQQTICEENRFFPVLGNHDYNTRDDGSTGVQEWLDYFPTEQYNEENEGRYYDFRVGENLHFFALNINPDEPDGITQDSPQALWLKRKLIESSAKFKIVYGHTPPYSSNPNFTTQCEEVEEGEEDCEQPQISDIRWPFKKWGATVVISGDDHYYERNINAGFTNFVCGLGGHPFIKNVPDSEIISGNVVHYEDNYGALLVDVFDNYMTFRFITVDNEVIDTFSYYEGDYYYPFEQDNMKEEVKHGMDFTETSDATSTTDRFGEMSAVMLQSESKLKLPDLMLDEPWDNLELSFWTKIKSGYDLTYENEQANIFQIFYGEDANDQVLFGTQRIGGKLGINRYITKSHPKKLWTLWFWKPADFASANATGWFHVKINVDFNSVQATVSPPDNSESPFHIIGDGGGSSIGGGGTIPGLDEEGGNLSYQSEAEKKLIQTSRLAYFLKQDLSEVVSWGFGSPGGGLQSIQYLDDVRIKLLFSGDQAQKLIDSEHTDNANSRVGKLEEEEDSEKKESRHGVLNVFPNPVTNSQINVQFKLNESSPVHLSLIDLSGRMVFESLKSFSEGSHIYTVENARQLVPNGDHLLILKVETESWMSSKLVILERN